LDDYYNTPPVEDPYIQPVRQASPLRSIYDDEFDEPIPIQLYISSQKQLPSSPPHPYSPHSNSIHNTPTRSYSPIPPTHHSHHNTPTQVYPLQNTYSPHTLSTLLQLQQKYSPTPPVHSTPPTTARLDRTPPLPPSRASASPRTPLHGPSHHSRNRPPSTQSTTSRHRPILPNTLCPLTVVLCLLPPLPIPPPRSTPSNQVRWSNKATTATNQVRLRTGRRKPHRNYR